jgi:putative hydrolase of the HAD superfamily
VRFTTIFFDLDDTLYPATTGLWEAIKERMNLYMRDRLGIPAQDIPKLREGYFREYGTTLRGLQANHGVDPQDFLAFVHDLPLQEYLRPAPLLREIIDSLEPRKVIFTNADAPHARRVLNTLGLAGCFETVVDVHTVAPYCKPMPESFQIALQVAGESDPRRCVMIDDLPHTTRAAREAGLFGVLYGQRAPHPDSDAVLDDWRRLPALLDGSAR